MKRRRVFEAGLFGGALGIRRTFILHAQGSKLPSDVLGLTSVRYDRAASAAEVRGINQKLPQGDRDQGRRGLVEGLWWQLSLTVRSEDEPSAVSLLGISPDRDGGLNVNGRAWQEDGTLSARYWSEASKEPRDPAVVEPNREQLRELARLADGGELRPAVDSTFPLERGAEAFERVAARGKRGKVVLDVAGS